MLIELRSQTTTPAPFDLSSISLFNYFSTGFQHRGTEWQVKTYSRSTCRRRRMKGWRRNEEEKGRIFRTLMIAFKKNRSFRVEGAFASILACLPFFYFSEQLFNPLRSRFWLKEWFSLRIQTSAQNVECSFVTKQLLRCGRQSN